MTRLLITASFVVGVVPVTILLVLYIMRTPWRARNNPAGKAMLALFLATELGYLLSIAVLTFPGWGQSPAGEWFRIVARTLIGAIFWFLLAVFRKAQKAGAAHDAALAGLEAARSYIQDQPGREQPAAPVDPLES
jgi:hypothetical protein